MQRMNLLFLVFNFFAGLTEGQSQGLWAGVYNYTKGVNKPFGIVHITPVKPDTVFFMLNTVSGDPDFLSTELKGFLRIDSSEGMFQGKAACKMHFKVNKSMLLIEGDSLCKFEYTPTGKYRRVNDRINKSAALLFSFTERKGIIKKEGCEVFEAPHPDAKLIRTFAADAEIRILDEFNQYFLVEKKEFSKEYLWVLKKNVTLRK